LRQRPIIVCTEYRGVFFGYPRGSTRGDTIVLTRARMAIYWGTTRGLFELAETGPTSSSKISARAEEITLHRVTSWMAVTKEAAQAWERA
jgi:hypothetical protein